MKDINTVVMTGRLTADKEVKYLEKFVAVNFTIAVNEYQDGNASYFDVKLTCPEYKKLFDYLNKGVKIGIEGKLKQERWKTQEGQTRSKIVVKATVYSITLMGGGNKNGNGQSGNDDNYNNGNNRNEKKNYDNNNQNTDVENDDEEDDLPF